MLNFPAFEVDKPATATDLARAGLLQAGQGCRISPHAIFIPSDLLGTLRPIELGERCVIGAGAVLHGGVRLGTGVHVENHTIVGKPEHGYAVREVYPGAGAVTSIAAGVILRAGATIYAGVTVGEDTTIGHHTLLRSHVTVGPGSQLAHHLTVERGSQIGAGVRCSPASHITADTYIGERVFLGAGVRTINDKELIWRNPQRQPPLSPPRFDTAARVGSGATILAGVTIGTGALVGAGSVVSSSDDTTICAACDSLSVPPSKTNITPSVRPARGGTQSTTSSRPGATDSPSSSFSSRTAASYGDSSPSTAPPGTSQ